MSFRVFFHRSQPRRKVRGGNPRHAGRRPRFEALEERRMLSLNPAVNYPVGKNPQAMASADFNGDCHLDLVTADAGSNTVSVPLGNDDDPAITSDDGEANSVTLSVCLTPACVRRLVS
jgi:hypothetical protein